MIVYSFVVYYSQVFITHTASGRDWEDKPGNEADHNPSRELIHVPLKLMITYPLLSTTVIPASQLTSF